MEEQQTLDFNRPVLSVRRFGPTAPDAEIKARTDTAHQNNYLSIPFYKADLKSGPIRNAGKVPFVWEKIPGRPKHKTISLHQNSELPPIAPRLPPGRRRDAIEKLDHARSPDCLTTDLPRAKNVKSPYRSIKCSNVKMEKLWNFQEGRAEPESFSSEEDDDDTYVDARDTLSVSKSESFFNNCSLSGLSGMDGSDAIFTSTVTADPQDIDFLMGRFLPAAKAMVLETPLHSSKRMYTVHEQPKQATVTVNAVEHISTPDYKPNLLRHYIQNDIEEDSEDDQINISSKGCGLLPRFCLLSPVPAMRTLPQTKAKSVRSVPASCFSTVHGTTINSDADRRTNEIHEDWSSSSIEPAFNEIEYFQCNRRDEKPFAETSIISKQAKNFASGGPKALKTFQDFLLEQNDEHEPPQEIPVVEKTLYIDSGHGTETPNSTEAVRYVTMISKNYDKVQEKVNSSAISCSCDLVPEMMDTSIADDNSFLKDGIMNPFVSVGTLPAEWHHCSQEVTIKCSMKDEFFNRFSASEDSKGVESKDQKKQEFNLVESNKAYTVHAYPHLPVPPPLPNSPSDSWLCRALPSMSSKNQFSRSYQGSPMQIYGKQNFPKLNCVDPKWETMVKAYKPQRGHHRYSEEMLAPIPEV